MLIVKPVITEKTLRMAEVDNTYAFEVNVKANKTAAAQEIEKAFSVNVESVRTLVRPGKVVFFGRRPGIRSDKKIMYFTLKSGEKIDLFTR